MVRIIEEVKTYTPKEMEWGKIYTHPKCSALHFMKVSTVLTLEQKWLCFENIHSQPYLYKEENLPEKDSYIHAPNVRIVIENGD